MDLIGYAKCDGCTYPLVCTTFNKNSQAWILLKPEHKHVDIKEGRFVIRAEHVLEIIDIGQRKQCSNMFLLPRLLKKMFTICRCLLSEEPEIIGESKIYKLSYKQLMSISEDNGTHANFVIPSTQWMRLHGTQLRAFEYAYLPNKNFDFAICFTDTSNLGIKKGGIRKLMKPSIEDKPKQPAIVASGKDCEKETTKHETFDEPYSFLFDEDAWADIEDECVDEEIDFDSDSNKSCRKCGSTDVTKYGFSENNGPQRYICKNEGCGHSFSKSYKYNAYDPNVIKDIERLLAEGKKVHDIAKTLNVSRGKVTSTRAKMARIKCPIDFMEYYYTFMVAIQGKNAYFTHE